MSNRIFVLAFAALVAGGASAQSNPPGAAVPPNTPGIATGKAERAAEARKDMRPAGQVKKPGGDQATAPEGGAI
ncbi:MAG: cell envelope biogenesis protein TolA, partial [Variovorax sp.]